MLIIFEVNSRFSYYFVLGGGKGDTRKTRESKAVLEAAALEQLSEDRDHASRSTHSHSRDRDRSDRNGSSSNRRRSRSRERERESRRYYVKDSREYFSLFQSST